MRFFSDPDLRTLCNVSFYKELYFHSSTGSTAITLVRKKTHLVAYSSVPHIVDVFWRVFEADTKFVDEISKLFTIMWAVPFFSVNDVTFCFFETNFFIHTQSDFRGEKKNEKNEKGRKKQKRQAQKFTKKNMKSQTTHRLLGADMGKRNWSPKRPVLCSINLPPLGSEVLVLFINRGSGGCPAVKLSKKEGG